MTEASPEERWLTKRIYSSGGGVVVIVVSGLVRVEGGAAQLYMLLHAPTKPRGARVLCQWRRQINGKLVQIVSNFNG